MHRLLALPSYKAPLLLPLLEFVRMWSSACPHTKLFPLLLPQKCGCELDFIFTKNKLLALKS